MASTLANSPSPPDQLRDVSSSPTSTNKRPRRPRSNTKPTSSKASTTSHPPAPPIQPLERQVNLFYPLPETAEARALALNMPEPIFQYNFLLFFNISICGTQSDFHALFDEFRTTTLASLNPEYRPWAEHNLRLTYRLFGRHAGIARRFNHLGDGPEFLALAPLAPHRTSDGGKWQPEVCDQEVIASLIWAMADGSRVVDMVDTKPWTHWRRMRLADFAGIAYKVCHILKKSHAGTPPGVERNGYTFMDRFAEVMELMRTCKGSVVRMFRPSTIEEMVTNPRKMRQRFGDNQVNNLKKKHNTKEAMKQKLLSEVSAYHVLLMDSKKRGLAAPARPNLLGFDSTFDEYIRDVEEIARNERLAERARKGIIGMMIDGGTSLRGEREGATESEDAEDGFSLRDPGAMMGVMQTSLGLDPWKLEDERFMETYDFDRNDAPSASEFGSGSDSDSASLRPRQSTKKRKTAGKPGDGASMAQLLSAEQEAMAKALSSRVLKKWRRIPRDQLPSREEVPDEVWKELGLEGKDMKDIMEKHRRHVEEDYDRIERAEMVRATRRGEGAPLEEDGGNARIPQQTRKRTGSVKRKRRSKEQSFQPAELQSHQEQQEFYHQQRHHQLQDLMIQHGAAGFMDSQLLDQQHHHVSGFPAEDEHQQQLNLDLHLNFDMFPPIDEPQNHGVPMEGAQHCVDGGGLTAQFSTMDMDCTPGQQQFQPHHPQHANSQYQTAIPENLHNDAQFSATQMFEYPIFPPTPTPGKQQFRNNVHSDEGQWQ